MTDDIHGDAMRMLEGENRRLREQVVSLQKAIIDLRANTVFRPGAGRIEPEEGIAASLGRIEALLRALVEQGKQG